MKEKTQDLRQDYEILQQTVVDDEPIAAPEFSLADKLKEKKAKERKQQIRRYVIIGVLSFLSYGIYFLFKPFQGTLPYGICKVFLELNVPYPETILLSEVSTTRNGSIRIWFAHIDSFGSYRLESFNCTFAVNQETKMFYLSEAKLGKLDVDPVLVDGFNKALPYLVTAKLDLNMPTPLPDSLSAITFEFDRFRPKIFD